MSNEYDGPECQQKYMVKKDDHFVQFHVPKPSHSITFHNADGYQVGVMDFNGPGLAFEGNAEQGAIVFMDWVSKTFMGRLKEEYERGFTDGKASK